MSYQKVALLSLAMSISTTGTLFLIPSNQAKAATTTIQIQDLRFSLPGIKHIVSDGDTLWALSRNYNITIEAIASANHGIDYHSLQIGQELNIPIIIENNLKSEDTLLFSLPIDAEINQNIGVNQYQLIDQNFELSFNNLENLSNLLENSTISDLTISDNLNNKSNLTQIQNNNPSKLTKPILVQKSFNQNKISQYKPFKSMGGSFTDEGFIDSDVSSNDSENKLRPLFPLEDQENQSSSVAPTTDTNLDAYVEKLKTDIKIMRLEYLNRQQNLDNNPTLRSNNNLEEENNHHYNLASNNRNVHRSYGHNQMIEAVKPELPPLSSSDNYLPETPPEFDGYIWPAKGVMTSGYGWRWGRLHKGIDIAAPIGTPIMAAGAGEVVSAGWNSGGFGKLVKLKHPDGSLSLYAHNNRILVRKGQKVKQGQQIAEMGSTGFSTGPHLHFEIHPPGKGAANPMAFLPRK